MLNEKRKPPQLTLTSFQKIDHVENPGDSPVTNRFMAVDPAKDLTTIGFIKKYFENNPGVSYIQPNSVLENIDDGAPHQIQITHGIIKMNMKTNTDANPQLYKMLENIGSGGSGEVWEILPLEPSRAGKDFSIVKISSPQAIEEEVSFRREKLQEIIGLTEQPDDNPGQSYMFDHKVEGQTLGNFFKQIITQSGSEEIQLKVMLAVLEKLKELHEKGFVHSDFHSDNILIKVADNGEISVSIIDYRFSGVEGELARGNIAPWAHVTQGALESRIYTADDPRNMQQESEMDLEQLIQSLGATLNKKTDIYNLGKSLKIKFQTGISPKVIELLDSMAPNNGDPALTEILTTQEYISKIKQYLTSIKSIKVDNRKQREANARRGKGGTSPITNPNELLTHMNCSNHLSRFSNNRR